MGMTQIQIMTEVADRVGVDMDEDATEKRIIRRAVQRAERYVRGFRRWNRVRGQETYGLTSESTVSALPSAFQGVYNVTCSDGTGTWVLKHLARDIEIDRYGGLDTRGRSTPYRYHIQGSNLIIAPYPSIAFTVVLDYWSVDVTFENDSDELWFPDLYVDAIIDGALWAYMTPESGWEASCRRDAKTARDEILVNMVLTWDKHAGPGAQVPAMYSD